MEDILNVLLKKRKTWTLYEDSQLRLYLENQMNLYETTSKDIDNCMDELDSECKRLSLRLETIHSNISALKFSKSIIERIADVSPERNKEPKKADNLSNDEKTKAVLQKVVSEGIKFVEKYFKEVDIVSKDFFSEVDSSFVLSPAFEVANPYAGRPFAEMIGSEAFINNFTYNNQKIPDSDEPKMESITIKMPDVEQQRNLFAKTQSLTAEETKSSASISQINSETIQNRIPNTSKNVEAKKTKYIDNSLHKKSFDLPKQNDYLINDNKSISKNNIKVVSPIPKVRSLVNDSKIISKTNIEKNSPTSQATYTDVKKQEFDILSGKSDVTNRQAEFKIPNCKFEKSSKGLFSSSSSENDEKETEKKHVDLKNSLNHILIQKLKSNNEQSTSSQLLKHAVSEQLLLNNQSKDVPKILQQISTSDSPSNAANITVNSSTITETSDLFSANVNTKLLGQKRTKGPDRRVPTIFCKKNVNTLETTTADNNFPIPFKKSEEYSNNINTENAILNQKETLSKTILQNLNTSAVKFIPITILKKDFSTQSSSNFANTKTENDSLLTKPTTISTLSVDSSLNLSTVKNKESTTSSTIHTTNKKNSLSKLLTTGETTRKINSSIFDSSTSDEDDLFLSRSTKSILNKTPVRNSENVNSFIASTSSTTVIQPALNKTLDDSIKSIISKQKVSSEKIKKSLFDDSDSDF